MSQPLQKITLEQNFRNLGIRAGDRLVIHSSLRAIGPVEGGADTVLDALLSCVGKEGLLVVPTFTYYGETFDSVNTPSRTGILTELLRKRPGSVRSLHPTHSVAAFGRGADEICEGHERVPGLGVDSPLDRMAKSGACVLLLGVGHTSNSTVHVGEAYANVPYGDIPFNPAWPTRIPVTVAGNPALTVDIHEHPGCSRAFGAIEAGLRQNGSIRDGMVGHALSQFMPGQAILDATVEMLRPDVGALLCRDSGCYRCRQARLRIAE